MLRSHDRSVGNIYVWQEVETAVAFMVLDTLHCDIINVLEQSHMDGFIICGHCSFLDGFTHCGVSMTRPGDVLSGCTIVHG